MNRHKGYSACLYNYVEYVKHNVILSCIIAGKFVKQFSTRPPLKMTPYLGEPVGLAVDPQGQVYVTDMQEERGGVHVFDGQTGKYLKKFEVATKVVMQAPAGKCISYVCTDSC